MYPPRPILAIKPSPPCSSPLQDSFTPRYLSHQPLTTHLKKLSLTTHRRQSISTHPHRHYDPSKVDPDECGRQLHRFYNADCDADNTQGFTGHELLVMDRLYPPSGTTDGELDFPPGGLGNAKSFNARRQWWRRAWKACTRMSLFLEGIRMARRRLRVRLVGEKPQVQLGHS